MPVGGTADVITPERKTHVRLDIKEPVVVEHPFAMHRAGFEIARGGLSPNNSSNVIQLASGAFTLEPVQQQKHKTHERGDTASSVIRASGFDLVSSIQEAPIHRKHTDLSGLTYDAAVVTSGDYFLQERIQGGATWGTELSADKTAFPGPTLPTANITLKRIAVSKGNPYPVNQGFGVRFLVPGTKQHAPDTIMVIYFGGTIGPLGQGDYSLALRGDGTAHLYRRDRPTVSDPYAWGKADEFRFAEPNRVYGASHDIQITPHVTPEGRRLIEFKMSSVARTPSAANLTAKVYAPPSIPSTHVYELTPLVILPPEVPKAQVTGVGPLRIDMNPAVRVKWQASVLKYETSGHIIDKSFPLPLGTRRTNLVLYWTAATPTGCTVVGRLFDSETGAELTEISRTTLSATYRINHGHFAYHAKIEMTGDGSKTPIFWGYSVVKDGVIEIVDVTEFEARTVTNVSITGAENDPSHETASCVIEDRRAEHSRLIVRGEFTAQIETEYLASSPSLRSVLHRGHLMRPKGRRHGEKRVGMGGAGSVRAYPAANWRSFECAFVGVWARLKKSRPMFRVFFGDDPAARGPNGETVPYKVTDVIYSAFRWAGFPAEMIDVPNLPYRLWPSLNNPDAQMLDPLADLQEFIWRLVRDYLGGFVIWDGNAGTHLGMDGKWRVKVPPTSPYTNYISFTTSAAAANRRAMRSQSYNSGITNWVRSDGTALTVPIVRRGGRATLETYTNPPEANMVIVSATGELFPNKDGGQQLMNFMANPKSYNFYTDAAGVTVQTADPNHPDYTPGGFNPVIIVDPALNSKEAVDFATRRYYDLTCRGVKMATFEAPLPLFVDPTDSLQTKPRPPRYYDPCLIDGTQFLIRSCSPSYTRDHLQFAIFECEAPRE